MQEVYLLSLPSLPCPTLPLSCCPKYLAELFGKTFNRNTRFSKDVKLHCRLMSANILTALESTRLFSQTDMFHPVSAVCLLWMHPAWGILSHRWIFSPLSAWWQWQIMEGCWSLPETSLLPNLFPQGLQSHPLSQGELINALNMSQLAPAITFIFYHLIYSRGFPEFW